jgi:thioredoxin-dependent peroxiredoxin
MIDVNTHAPDFLLQDSKDNSYSLASFKDKWIVLYFYPKDDTPGCTKEAIDFSALLDDFTKENAVVVGISADTKEKHQKFIDKYGLKVLLLADEDKKTLKDYGAWGLKKNYGREYEGIIRSTFIIDPKKIIRSRWRSVAVRVKKAGVETLHAQKVLEKLKDLKND